MSEKKLSELNQLYDEAEMLDKDVFAEMRSNILLVAGEHYTKYSPKYLNSIRNTRNLTESQKLRLTKNHIFKISKYYAETVLSLSPDGKILPRNDRELQDQKDADLHSSVYNYLSDTLRLKEKYREFCSDFVDVGECAALIKFDYTKGRHTGFEPVVDDVGNPIFDEMGEPVVDKKKPTFSGKFTVERLYGFNLLFHPGASDSGDAQCFIVRKMVPNKDLMAQFGDSDELKRSFGSNTHQEFVVFDAQKARYEKAKDQTLVREYYYPSCYKYPNGYYVIATESVILAEGELPGGIFPIVYAAFNRPQTARRGKSIIKIARPYQAEINRASSQAAQHQITVGDDKILYQSGTKLQSGALLPGVRGITYTGAQPEILPGRAGMQFVEYISQQITEMYQAVNMEEITREKESLAQDPYTMLYRSAKHKAYFTSYADKFGQFIKDFMETLLSLAKFYLPDDELIPAIGKNEVVNIAEFRSNDRLSHEIKIEAMDDTVDSMLGRQLTFNHILQYVGQNLDKESIGKLIKAMPYGNFESGFDDFTLDDDIVMNDMLAMERGELAPPPGNYDDHQKMIKRLSKRMREPDFKFLDPQIQNQYQIKINMHEKAEADRQAQLIAAKNEYIPADGPMIACDMYVEDPDPTKAPKRARVPQRALNWLLDQLEAQGLSLAQLENQNQGALAEMAQMLGAQQGVASPGQLPSLIAGEANIPGSVVPQGSF